MKKLLILVITLGLIAGLLSCNDSPNYQEEEEFVPEEAKNITFNGVNYD